MHDPARDRPVAGGLGIESGKHAARFATGRIGVFQGTRSYVLQDDDGQVLTTHSVSAGLDYASVGPEHSFLREIKRARYSHVNDDEAIAADVKAQNNPSDWGIN